MILRMPERIAKAGAFPEFERKARDVFFGTLCDVPG